MIAGREMHITKELSAFGVAVGKRFDFLKKNPRPSETKMRIKLFIILEYS